VTPIPSESERRGFLSLPNLLSLVRIPLAGVPWLDRHSEWLLFASLFAAAFTDWADGRVARGRGDAGATGAWLDPLCDKAFVVSVALLVFVVHDPPGWFVAAVLAREVLQAPLVLAYHLGPAGRERFDFTASLVGKATTCAQFLAIGALVLGLDVAGPLAVFAALLGILAVATYVRRFLRSRVS
jgi:phosphatidylglycerophosphate synthase